jgi:hypothetical protein
MATLYDEVLTARSLSTVGGNEPAQSYRARLLHPDSNASLCVPAVRECAVESYRNRVRVSPTDTSARNNLALMLMLQGRLAEAAEELRAVLRIDPSFQSSRNNLLFLDHVRSIYTSVGADVDTDMRTGVDLVGASQSVRRQLAKIKHPPACTLLLRNRRLLGGEELAEANRKCLRQVQRQVHQSVDEGTRRLCSKYPAMPLKWHKHP